MGKVGFCLFTFFENGSYDESMHPGRPEFNAPFDAIPELHRAHRLLSVQFQIHQRVDR